MVLKSKKNKILLTELVFEIVFKNQVLEGL